MVSSHREKENEHARAFVRRLMNERYEGKQSHLSKALGMSQPTVGNFLNGKQGIGSKLLAGLRGLTGAGEDEILGRGPAANARPDIPPDPRYPSRALAIAAANLAGIRPDAVETVAGYRFKGREGRDIDPGVEYWLGEVLHVAKQMDIEDRADS